MKCETKLDYRKEEIIQKPPGLNPGLPAINHAHLFVNDLSVSDSSHVLGSKLE